MNDILGISLNDTLEHSTRAKTVQKLVLKMSINEGNLAVNIIHL